MRSSWSLSTPPALRETPVKKSRRLSSRSKRVSLSSLQRDRLHAVVRVEGEAGDAAVGGDVLVLLSDGLLQALDLDLAGQPCQVAGQHGLHPVRAQRTQQRRGEAPGGAQAGARGNVRERADLDLRIFEVQRLQGLADDRVLDLVRVLNVLQLRVLDEDSRDRTDG